MERLWLGIYRETNPGDGVTYQYCFWISVQAFRIPILDMRVTILHRFEALEILEIPKFSRVDYSWSNFDISYLGLDFHLYNAEIRNLRWKILYNELEIFENLFVYVTENLLRACNAVRWADFIFNFYLLSSLPKAIWNLILHIYNFFGILNI